MVGQCWNAEGDRTEIGQKHRGANLWSSVSLPDPSFEGGCTHSLLVLAANKDTEQASTPWCESSPDDFRYGNLMYPDHREREKDQHEKNKR